MNDHHDRRLDERMEDPEFAEAYAKAQADLAELEEIDRPLTREEKKAKRERELAAARASIRLDPEAWQPPVLEEAPRRLTRRDPVYRAYREADRRFRRAFGRTGSTGGRRAQHRAAHALAHMVASPEQS